MKYILLTIVALITLSSCSDDSATDYKSDYSTFVYTLTELDWNLYDGNAGYFATINAPEINDDILDYGYFITYWNSGTDYVELPQTQVYTDGDGVTYSIELVPSYSFEQVKIEYFDTHPAGQQFPPFDYTFRTVIISEPYIINGIESGEIDTEYESVVSKMEDHDIKFQMIDSQ